VLEDLSFALGGDWEFHNSCSLLFVMKISSASLLLTRFTYSHHATDTIITTTAAVINAAAIVETETPISRSTISAADQAAAAFACSLQTSVEEAENWAGKHEKKE